MKQTSEQQKFSRRKCGPRFGQHTHRSLVELFERLLSVHVHAGEPAAEAGVRVVPPYHHLRAACLLEHVEHDCLVHVVDCLHTDSRAVLIYAAE
jgi:hypothetical protein